MPKNPRSISVVAVRRRRLDESPATADPFFLDTTGGRILNIGVLESRGSCWRHADGLTPDNTPKALNNGPGRRVIGMSQCYIDPKTLTDGVFAHHNGEEVTPFQHVRVF